MTHPNTSEARKYSVRYQLFFLILIGIFGLAILMSTIRLPLSEDQKLELYLDPWQLISLGLLQWVTDKNKYLTGIVFTFLCWFLPLISIQLLDSINSFGEISRSILPAAMAGLLFGPLLGRKLYSLKQDNLFEER